MTSITRLRAALVAAMAATTFVSAITSATADGHQSKNAETHVANSNDPGLIELYSTPEPGQITPMNWAGPLGGWGAGSHESRHWDDNNYTEIQFIGCRLDGATGKSAHVQLWQAIPFNLDKSMAAQPYYNCFTGPTSSTRAWWDEYFANGDQRYFTIPLLNGEAVPYVTISVDRVYVDTALAD